MRPVILRKTKRAGGRRLGIPLRIVIRAEHSADLQAFADARFAIDRLAAAT